MRISDWSSDVCSSDLIFDMGFSARAAVLAMGGSHHGLGPQPEHGDGGGLAFQPLRDIDDETERSWAADWIGALHAHENVTLTRSAERRVGNEWFSTCRSRWSPYH